MSQAAISASIAEHRAALDALAGMGPDIEAFARVWWDGLAAGGTVFLLGNGGSAGDSQHIAAELTGRFESERRGLRAVALTTDSSALTAIGNDYGYQRVFARQVEALVRPGDVVVCISTSGNSGSVVEAASTAKALRAVPLGLTGAGGGRLAGICARTLAMPAQRTARIQELHILVGHICCQLIDAWAAEGGKHAR